MINKLALEIYQWAEEKGWNRNLVLGNMIANLHTEISEAWEEIRNGHTQRELYYVDGKPEGFGIELADLIIRVLHIAALYDLDMEALIELKMVYNKTRPYRHGGKTA